MLLIFFSAFLNMSSKECLVVDLSIIGFTSFLNISSAFLRACTPILVSVPTIHFFKAVSDLSIGFSASHALNLSIFSASTTFGLIAVLYNASHDFFRPVPIIQGAKETIFASCFKILTGFITFCILSILLTTFVYPPVCATLDAAHNPPISVKSVSAGFSTIAFLNFQGVPYCSTIFAPIASIILASSVAGTSFPHSWLDIAFAIP